jgi:GTPase SAR1 family protein
MAIDTTLSASIQEIQRYLPDAKRDQAERFARQYDRLQQVREYFKLFPEDQATVERYLDRAEKALDYTRAYQIAVIGVSAAGKSTLINALLGGEYATTGHLGGAVTGTTLQFFFDAQRAGTAEVIYRDEDNIYELVRRYLVVPAKQSPDAMPYNIDANFKLFVQSLPCEDINLRDALVNLIDDFISHRDRIASQPVEKLDLSKETDRKRRDDLISEQVASTPPTSLINTVKYFINPLSADSQGKRVSLPNNACLVDLPGAGDRALHEMIIREGIRQADAVIFVVRPRQGREKDEKIMEEVKKYIHYGAVETNERVFLVVNNWDTIPIDDIEKDPLFRPFIEELLKLVRGQPAGNAVYQLAQRPYFLTSAALAVMAQQAMNKGKVSEPHTYTSLATKFGVTLPASPATADARVHETLFGKSGVPDLISSLNRFGRERLVEGQIHEGQSMLNSIIDELFLLHNHTRTRRAGDRGSGSLLRERVNERLDEAQGKLQEYIRMIQRYCIEQRDAIEQRMQDHADEICDDIDRDLQDQLPKLWEQHFVSSDYPRYAYDFGLPKTEQFIGQVELFIWEQLTYRLQQLAHALVEEYKQMLHSQRFAEGVQSLCYGHRRCDELILQWIEMRIDGNTPDSMKSILTNLSERVALSDLLTPTNSFLPKETLQDGSYNQRPIYTSLGEKYVPNQREVNAGHFNEFIKAVRQSYGPSVREASVRSLLNIYEYEIIQIRQDTIRRARQFFYEMANDASITERVRRDLPDLAELERLEQKLLLLDTLRAGMPAAPLSSAAESNGASATNGVALAQYETA